MEAVLVAWFGWATWVVTTPRFTDLPFPFMATDLMGPSWYAAAIGLLFGAGAVVRELQRRAAPLREDLWLLTAIPGFGLMRKGRWLDGSIWAGLFIGVGWLFSRQLEVAADYVARLGSSAVALLVAGLAGYIAWKYVARQRFLRAIRIARITPEDLKAKLDAGDDMMIVDLRARIDFDADPSIIPGALHLMIEELEARHREIPRDRDIVLYCT